MEISGFILPGAPGIAQKKQPGLLPPLTLAYMGDTIYDLFVRRRLIEQINLPTNCTLPRQSWFAPRDRPGPFGLWRAC